MLRIGFIGAGGNTRLRHLPGFQACDDIVLQAVCNRRRETAEAVAQEFGIATVYDNWQQLLADPAIDAVCIGTWPDQHAALTEAALALGKHVLCEARMARDLAEARRMYQAHCARPDLVAQLVPAPFTLQVDALVREQLASGAIGELVAVDAVFSHGFVDTESPYMWRHDPALSGLNTLTLGIRYETMHRWLGPVSRVAARSRVVQPYRRDANGQSQVCSIPDHWEIIGDLAGGATVHMRFSAACGADHDGFSLFGREGTLRVDNNSVSLCKPQAEPVTLPTPDLPEWDVEGQFVRSIRDGAPVTDTSFADGLRYMAFTEAVHKAAQTGAFVAVDPV